MSGVRRPEKQLTAARCTRRKTGCSRPRCTEINESGDILFLIYFHQATLCKIIILFVTCGILCKKIWSVSLITHSFSVFSFLMHAWQVVVRDGQEILYRMSIVPLALQAISAHGAGRREALAAPRNSSKVAL